MCELKTPKSSVGKEIYEICMIIINIDFLFLKNRLQASHVRKIPDRQSYNIKIPYRFGTYEISRRKNSGL
jgi:hypothetical protein